ncbi:MAG TPA: hypothetical protein VNO55_14105 [Polyangia bacterium]|nr:hypothetical protein [Polyangia bacterium]
MRSLAAVVVAACAAACASGCEGAAGDRTRTGGGAGGAPTSGSGGTSDASNVADGSADPDGNDANASEPVHGLAVTDVAIYQAVKVSLVKAGRPVVTPDTPLVRNRPALLRVFVTPSAGWQSRSVVARLQWNDGGPPKTTAALIAGASTDAILASTLNFSLAAADLTAQLKWSVSLLEAPGGTGIGDTTGARLPADGTAALLQTSDPGPSLKITFVPVRNKNTLPDTSPAQIKFLTDAMFATYPVAKIETTIREPIDFTGTISPTGPGWDLALNQVCQTRQNDRPARNVFYHGLVAPGPVEEFCPGGCFQGIAVVSTNPAQDETRCSIALGYTNMGSIAFMQEVAHTMGRSHAPCGQPPPARPDPLFPYPNAGIGVWGYDLVNQRLIDPQRRADFMSYCTPVWISDYTFSRLLPWIQAVNQLVP